AAFASASAGASLHLLPGTLRWSDSITPNVQLTLGGKALEIACGGEGATTAQPGTPGGVCTWQGTEGRSVVRVVDNGGTTGLVSVVIRDGDANQ
ncbi:hypothetical protein ScalyP_jg121, partial [Parmales sp. scaly parma]